MKRQRKEAAAVKRRQKNEEIQASRDKVRRHSLQPRLDHPDPNETDGTHLNGGEDKSARRSFSVSPQMSHSPWREAAQFSFRKQIPEAARVRRKKKKNSPKKIDHFEALKSKYYKPKPKRKELWEQDISEIVEVGIVLIN